MAEPYTPDELEAEQVHELAAKAGCWPHQVRAVLVAVLPDHDARVRARVAEEIAEDIEDNPGPDPSPAIPAWWSGWMEGRNDAAAIARARATTPTTEGDPDATT